MFSSVKVVEEAGCREMENDYNRQYPLDTFAWNSSVVLIAKIQRKIWVETGSNILLRLAR